MTDILSAPINLFQRESNPGKWHIMEVAEDFGIVDDNPNRPHRVLVAYCGELGDTSIENFDVYDLTGLEDYVFMREEKLTICEECHNNNYVPLCDWP